MPSQRLTEHEISDHLLKIPAWIVKDGRLHRQFKFPDFPLAIGFMMTVAVVAMFAVQ